MALHGVLDSVVSKVLDYCAKEETRARLESEVLAPVLKYMTDKFAWGVRIFQLVAVLVLIQTIILLYMLLRPLRPAANFF